MRKPRPSESNTAAVIKRLMDLCLTVPGLIVCAPLLAAIAIVIRCRLGSPIIFRQLRPGFQAAPFEIYKFRTMNDRRDQNGKLLSDGKRLTAFGSFLRRTSLDELPELFNVLKGNMSLVGPRPLLMEYLPYYTPEEQRRHEIRPGITGWAQIHGRNLLPWDQRLAMDVWYVDHRSLALDLRILCLTVWKVLRRDGAAADTDTVETNLHEERHERKTLSRRRGELALAETQYCERQAGGRR